MTKWSQQVIFSCMSTRAERDIRRSKQRQARRAHHVRPVNVQVEVNERGRNLVEALLASHKAHRDREKSVIDDR